jgi:hypothetical protein
MSWSKDDRSALREISAGETANERFGALNRTTVIESKFYLTAAAPICVLLIVRSFSGSSGWLWWVLVGVAALWLVFVLGVMFVDLLSAARRRSDRRD